MFTIDHELHDEKWCTYVVLMFPTPLLPHSLSPQASYGVEEAEYAVVQLAQTTMRSELGKIKLDSVFQERMNLNHSIVGKEGQKWVWSGVGRVRRWTNRLRLFVLVAIRMSL